MSDQIEELKILVRNFGTPEENPPKEGSHEEVELLEVDYAEAWEDHIQYNVTIGGQVVVIQIPRDILQKLIDLPSAD